MARVRTNFTAVAVADELAGSAGTLPASPLWRRLEPNNLPTFGATTETTPRDPITEDRQLRQGVPTNRTSAVEIEHDLVLDPFAYFAERFCYATAINGEMDIDTTVAETTGDSYTVAALSAAQANKLEFVTGQYATLIAARGFDNAGNNGLKQVDADIAASATAISVAENLVDETPTGPARIELAGLRSLAAAADFTWAWDGTNRRATLTSAADITDFTQFGFVVGQSVHIGSRDANNAIQNAFENSAANDMFGFARVIAIGTNTVTFDKVAPALQFDDATAPTTAVDLMFGKFINNVSASDSRFFDTTQQFEAVWNNLQEPGPGDEYEYPEGNSANTLGIALALNSLATFTAGFVGTDTPSPVTTRKTNAANPLLPIGTQALSTAGDVAQISIAEADDDGLTTFFDTLNFNIDNGVTAENALGTLGAQFVNQGNFTVSIDTRVKFTNSAVINAVRDNTRTRLAFALRNDDATMFFEIPSMTLGDGTRDLVRNETVRVQLTAQAFIDPVLNTSIGISIFPVRL